MNLATFSVQQNNSIMDIEQDGSILSRDKRKFQLSNIKEQKKLDFIVINKLIETLNNEVRDKLRHPQWKHFKHMQLGDPDTARISNIIWRSWHLKFHQCYKNSCKSIPFLDFSIPDLDTSHSQSKSVVLEGQYWYRKDRRVALEYANWRQEFMNRVKQSRFLHKESSITEFKKTHYNHYCPTSEYSTNPDFPIFTQSEIDSLIMLDKHDTLFTSNISESECLPPDGVPQYFGYQNSCNFIQPTLDHLNPFYQGYYAPISNSNSIRSPSLTNIVASNSIYSNNSLNPICDVSHLNESEISNPDLNSPLSLNRLIDSKTHSQQISRTSSNYLRNDWGEEYLSDISNTSFNIESESYTNNQCQLTLSPKKSSIINHLANSMDNYNTPHNVCKSTCTLSCTTPRETELMRLVESLQLRVRQVEELVAQQQKFLKPLFDHSTRILSSPDSNSTADSTSPIPPAKRICSSNDSPIDNPKRLFSMMQPIINSPSNSDHNNSISSPYLPTISKYSSDHKRRSGIKISLQRLESILPMRYLDGSRLSNATLLIKAAEYAKCLCTQVKELEKESKEFESNLEMARFKNKELNKLLPLKSIVFPSISCLDANRSKIDDYAKERSLKDPKYFIFSKIMKPIFEDYNTTYFPNSQMEFKKTMTQFLSKSFSLANLKNGLSNAICELNKDTRFLRNPEMLEKDIQNMYKIDFT